MVLYLTAALVVFVDQLTKFLAVHFLAPRGSLPVVEDVFHLTFVENTGIAFGLFRAHPELLLFFITLSLAGLAVWAGRAKTGPLARVGLALILGGAIGNWIDRIRVGAVIDFLDFRVWPVFNLADSAITIGVAFYLISFFQKART